MKIACPNETVVTNVRAALLKYEMSQVGQQGPNFGNPMIWVMVNVTISDDEECAIRRKIAGIAGATLH